VTKILALAGAHPLYGALPHHPTRFHLLMQSTC